MFKEQVSKFLETYLRFWYEKFAGVLQIKKINKMVCKRKLKKSPNFQNLTKCSTILE